MGDGVKQEVRSQGKHWAEKFIASHKHIDKRTCKQVSCSSHYSTSLKVNISGCLTDLKPGPKAGILLFCRMCRNHQPETFLYQIS